jgi:hypothetical protein
MYIGSTVNVLSRQLRFVDYGNDFTKKRLGYKKERSEHTRLIGSCGVPLTRFALVLACENLYSGC